MAAADLSSALRAAVEDRAFLAWENRMLWRAVGTCGVLLVALGVAVAALAVRGEPEPDIVASTPDGRIVRAQRLDEPMMTMEAFRQGVGRAIAETFTLGFHDYKLRLDRARMFYTPEAFEDLVGELEKTGFLRRLTEGYQVVETVLDGAPALAGRQEEGGVLYLAFRTPVLMSFRAGSKTRHERMSVKSLVRRTRLVENPRGWAIAQTVVERRVGQ